MNTAVYVLYIYIYIYIYIYTQRERELYIGLQQPQEQQVASGAHGARRDPDGQGEEMEQLPNH